MSFDKDRVRARRIADNGCGFMPDERDPARAIGEHLGLLTMRERAARLRGRLDIDQQPWRRHDDRGVGTDGSGVILDVQLQFASSVSTTTA